MAKQPPFPAPGIVDYRNVEHVSFRQAVACGQIPERQHTLARAVRLVASTSAPLLLPQSMRLLLSSAFVAQNPKINDLLC